MDDILRDATEAIKKHPYNFMYTPELQRAFRALEQGIKERTEDADTLVVSLPETALKDKGKISMLPLPVTEDTDSNGIEMLCFDWFSVPENKTGFGIVVSDFVGTLIHALDALPENKQLSPDEIREVKEKYIPGTKLRIIKMCDDHAPETGSEYEVDLVDDYGQIHVKGLSLRSFQKSTNMR